MSDSYTFYDQQIEMSERILSRFTSGEGELYGILLAQMQSGKSGTYYRLALESVHRGFFESVFIICGSRDTALREQTKEGLQAAIDAFCEEKNLSHSKGKRLERSIKVYWNQELKSAKISDSCLIINDESHTAQSKSNIPFKEFWKANGLTSCLYGEFSVLIDRNIRVLSVSATSFSECVENQKVSIGMDIHEGVKLTAKNVFIMEPGSTYTGVAKFLENGRIKFTSKPVTEKTQGVHLCSILQLKKYSRKYCLVRTKQATLDEPLVRQIAKVTGSEYKGIHGDALKVYDDDGNKINPLEFLSDPEPPTKTTLVHICGAFRMGQVLDKTHIGFVYEQSSSPQIDTLLQGLLGRVCGHDANLDVDIYVSSKRKEEIENYAEAVNLSDAECMASFAKIRPALNVKSGGGNKHTLHDTIKDKSGGYWRKMIPIKFHYSILGVDFDTREITHEDILNLFSDHPELLESNPDQQFILDELNNPKHEGRISNRDLHSESYKNRGTAVNLDRAIKKRERCTDWFTNVVCDHETTEVVPFTVLYNKSTHGDVYFIGFAPDKDMSDTLWKRYMGMNNTHKKCNYNPAHVVTTETGKKIPNVNGGQVIRFPQETSTSEVELHHHLREAIIRSQQNPLAQKEISSLWCDTDKSYKGIRLYKNVFTREMINDVKSKLNGEFNIDIEFAQIGKWNENPGKSYYRYSSISW